MSGTGEFGQGRSADLARLNDAERRVLRLLSEGHTAKSIATELGTTAAAINERLREARRKTGVGSSRELARSLKAQENRHDFIALGKAAGHAEKAPKMDVRSWRSRAGVFAMISLMLTLTAGAVALMSQTPPPSNEIDPLVGVELPSGPDPATLHARVRAEPRDSGWAAPLEKQIRDRATKIPLIGQGGNVLRITCATTLCEIAGTIEWPGPPPKEYDPKLPQNQAQQALQGSSFNDDLAKLGLRSESGFFTGAKDEPKRAVFLLYYVRKAERHD